METGGPSSGVASAGPSAVRTLVAGVNSCDIDNG